jgi:hypothetical protein
MSKALERARNNFLNQAHRFGSYLFAFLFPGKELIAHRNHPQEGFTMNTNIPLLDFSKKCASLKIGVNKKLHFSLG